MSQHVQHVRNRITAWRNCLSCSLSLQVLPAPGQYPSRPIEFIVPWARAAARIRWRASAQLMAKELKVSLPVLNVAGATGQTVLPRC